MCAQTPKPKVLFRADAGGSIGFGHLVRSSALATMLRDDFDCMMACRCDVPAAQDFIERTIAGAGAQRLRITDSAGSYDDAFLSMLDRDIITVLDNYFYDTRYQAEARSKSRALVSIDDMPDRHFVSDVFFTHSPFVRTDFSLEPYTEFHGGTDWTFLRSPFLKPKPQRRHDTIGRVVISMGGSDPLGLTDIFVEMTGRILPGCRIDVIAGPASNVISRPQGRVEVSRNIDAAEIVRILDRADFGIFPSSTGAIEALSRGLPAATGWFEQNQRRLYDHVTDRGLFQPLGNLKRPVAEIEEDLRAAIANHGNYKVPRIDFDHKRKEIIEIFKRIWKDSENRI